MNKITNIFIVLIALLFFVPFSAKADGGIFYPEKYPVYEKGQKAFIYYHEGVEDLVVQPSYQGSSKDFVWVMPTPSEPKTNKSSQSIFTALQKLTVPDTTYHSSGITFGTLSTKTDSSEVQIIEEKTIDAFNIVTLKASSETALSEWMKTNKYSFPEDKNYLLSDYINEGWYFVIAKIRPEAQTGAQSDLNNGTITPIRFTFKSDKIIYPMKLTRVAMEQEAVSTQSGESSTTAVPSAIDSSSSRRNRGTDITIYVLSDNRIDNSQLSISWANWLKVKDIKKILAESTETNWIQSDRKLFLTKMYQYAYSDQIKDDIVITNYKNNDAYPIPFYKEGYYWLGLLVSFGIAAVILLFSPLFLLFVIFSLKEKYDEKWQKKAKWFKVIFLTLFLILGIAILVLAWIGSHGFTHLVEMGGFVGAAIAYIILETLLIISTIKDFVRQKRAVVV